jgi:uridylate kinase
MCRDNNLPLRVFNMLEANSLVRAMTDPNVGTLVTA